ncbi:MAG: AlkA N-terminal domain-containing protein [Verrucomicrobiota bacterium]
MNPLDANNDNTLYQALRSRDRRFDGAFFVGVTSTGIYCRPVCPSRTPLRKNCRFFVIAAAAQDAGFRACLRCRPELAPAVHRAAESGVASQLVALLRQAALEGGSMEEVAQQSGWSVRQLSRKLAEECGTTPGSIMRTERLLFAKRLLHETDLSMTEVALRSGFRSVRRFNAEFAEKSGMTPGAIREKRMGKVTPGSLRLRLDYRPPYAWSEMLGWLRARATRGVEVVSDDAWTRAVRVGGHEGWLQVSQDSLHDCLIVELSSNLTVSLPQLVRRLRSLFDLDANPAEMLPLFENDPLLGQVADRYPGLRIPGAWDLFETAVRTVIGQQVTVAAATTVAGRLAARLGERCASNPHGLEFHAVTPAALAVATVDELAALGMPGKRALALQTLARHAMDGGLEILPFATLEEVSRSLTELPGIGPWTADYIAMRALRHPDAFPAGDIALRKALGDGIAISQAAAETVSQRWRPWRAYAAALLWQLPKN